MKILFVFSMLFLFLVSIDGQEITMFPGFGVKFYQDDKRISKKEANRLLLKNRASKDLWKKAKRQRYGTFTGLAGEVVFLIWTANRALAFKNPWGTYAGALGSAGLASGFTYNRLRLQKEAILAYNASFDE